MHQEQEWSPVYPGGDGKIRGNIVTRAADIDQAIHDRIKSWQYQLHGDAVGLWQILPALRADYSLPESHIQKYVMQIVAALLRYGAKPVFGHHPDDGNYSWRPTDKYGATIEEMSRNIAREFSSTHNRPSVEDVWFALPDIYDRPRVPGRS